MKAFLATLIALVATPVLASGPIFVDLTYPYDQSTIYWPTAPGFDGEVVFDGTTEAGYEYEAHTVGSAEQGGAPRDAPVHFAEGKHTADEVPLSRLIGPAVVVDVTEQAAANRDYQVSVQDFVAWEAENGRLPDSIIVLIRTGYGKFWPDREKYMGTAERGEEAVAKLHFPGLHPDTAQWLVENRDIHSIGLDTPSIDYGQSKEFESHRILFEQNIPAFENLANLDILPNKGFDVIALPMKIAGGSGGPLRIVAVVP